jgi:hypothetical protein
MKTFKTLLLYKLFITVILLSSCTEKIDLDLNSSDPKIVIEGSVSTTGESVIKITESVNFYESNDFPRLQNAFVEISDNLGNSEVLLESSEGIYSTTSFGGVEGRTYFLNVQIDDKTIESVSNIPNHVRFDSLIIIKTTMPGIPGAQENDSAYQVMVRYKDPVDEVNFYRFVEIVNNVTTNSYVFNDRINNGKNVMLPLINFSRELTPGDVIKIEMQCIDESVYEYFNSIGNTQGGTATPANPYTNIIGSELGYFSAHTSEFIEVIIP